MQRKIAVVGSWRPAEREDSQESRGRFFDLSRAIGAWVYDKGYTLRVGWSNDHLHAQCRPERDNVQHINKNPDGTLGADEGDCLFLFQDTADYHAMTGYLEAAKQRPRGDAQIELEINKQMYEGATERGMIVWPPVADREIIPGWPLRDHVAGGLISLTDIPTYKISRGTRREYLRSDQLLHLIDGNNAVDLVLGLGGGKASDK